MRMGQHQVLTPRMIQSMEVLQLPLGALEERVGQELQKNPLLDVRTRDADAVRMSVGDDPRPALNRTEDERRLVLNENGSAADFQRLERLSGYLENEEFSTNSGFRRSHWEGQDRDGKLDAMANSAARAGTITDHLHEQWRFVEAPPEIKHIGNLLIDYIDADGYLRTPFERMQHETAEPIRIEQLQAALPWVQELDPPGVGARDLAECLLLQLDAMEEDEELAEGHDFRLERALVRDHLNDLAQNRYPLISKRLGVEIETIKAAVKRLSRLQPHPGRAYGVDEAPPITPDARIFLDEDTGQYVIKMARDIAPSLHIKAGYVNKLKKQLEAHGDKKLKEFLKENLDSAKWLIDSIEQRRSTIERVIRIVVDTQKDFFEHGPEHLKPLPMISVADQLGIHVATVSRAVSEKWVQTPRGVFPLRRFFSGGTQSASGEDMSWDAVKEKLKILIDNEDKQNPMSDDELVDKLVEQGIDIARRTVAKYRKVLNIPTARQRKAY